MHSGRAAIAGSAPLTPARRFGTTLLICATHTTASAAIPAPPVSPHECSVIGNLLCLSVPAALAAAGTICPAALWSSTCGVAGLCALLTVICSLSATVCGQEDK